MIRGHRLLVSAALVFAALLGAGSVLADQGGHCDRQHHAGKMGRHGDGHGFQQKLKDLNLRDAQQAQVQQIMDKQQPLREAKWKEMRESRQALHEAARGDKYDSAKVRELAGKQAQLQAEMTVLRIETMHQVYALLTPEQKQKWDAKRERRHESEKS